MFGDFDSYDPSEGMDDLQEFSEAWEDAQAEMGDEESEGMDMPDPDTFDRQAESVLYPWLDTDALADECRC